jgi:hypothetical protein
MKKIIEGKVYNTEGAEVVFGFRRKYSTELTLMPGLVHNFWEDAEYLKTEKGAWLYYCESQNDLRLTTEEEVKKTIANVDPDRYMELFGELEEG